MGVVQKINGKIGYYDADGVETGREWFWRTREGGYNTLRAYCEMDRVPLTRDVTLAMDSEMRPTDAFVRLTQHGQVTGSSWFLIEPDAVICEAQVAGVGRVSQRFPTEGRLPYLGLHPLAGDGLMAIWRGTDAPGEFRTLKCVANSSSPDGEKGLIAEPTSLDATYVGEEDITVAAGVFKAHRFGLRWSPEWPVADLWTHGDDHLFLRLSWSFNRTSYELLEWDQG